MKKLGLLLMTLVLTIAFCSLVNINAEASTINNINITGKVQTKSTGLNLRKQANTSSTSTVIISIPKGKTVTILSKKGQWYQVKYNGYTGFVSAEFIVPAYPVKALKASGFVKVNATKVYTYPEDTSAVVATFNQNTAVTVTGSYGAWYKVTIGSKTGFIKASQFSQDFVVTPVQYKGYLKTNATKVYLTPNNQTTVVGTFNQNTAVTVTGLYGVWYKATIGGKTGFIKASQFSKEPILKAASGSATVKVAGNLIEVLSNLASKNGTVKKGDTVTVTGSYGAYYQVKTSAGKVGFLKNTSLELFPAFSEASNKYAVIRWTVNGYDAPNKLSKATKYTGYVVAISHISKDGKWAKVEFKEKGKKKSHYFSTADIQIKTNKGKNKTTKNEVWLDNLETDFYMLSLEYEMVKRAFNIDLSIDGITKAAYEKQAKKVYLSNEAAIKAFIKKHGLNPNIFIKAAKIVGEGLTDWEGFVEGFDTKYKLALYAQMMTLNKQKGMIVKTNPVLLTVTAKSQ